MVLNKAQEEIESFYFRKKIAELLNGGVKMKPENTTNTLQPVLEHSTQLVALDRSEYNMLIKAQGLLDLIRSTYKNAAADYRLCEFLDIIFKDEEEK